MEEFSFPAIAVAQSCASPLWFHLPVPPKDAAVGRRGLAMAEDEGKAGAYVPNDVGREERMDVLWEEFNEELHRLSCEHTGQAAAEGSECCMAAVDRRRRTRLVLTLKVVLKKLLVILKLKRDPPAGVCFRIDISD